VPEERRGIKKSSARSFYTFKHKEDISKKEYYFIFKAFIFLAIRYMLSSGMGVKLPYNLGYIRTKDIKVSKKILNEDQKVVRHVTMNHTRIKLRLKLNKFYIRNLALVRFKPARSLKNILRQTYNKNPSITEIYG